MSKKIVSHAAIKLKTMRASTYAEKMKSLSKGDLLRLLSEIATDNNEELYAYLISTGMDPSVAKSRVENRNDLKTLVTKYLVLYHSMNLQQIKDAVANKIRKREIRQDLGNVGRGTANVQDVANKWGIPEEAVETEAMKMIKYEIPTGQVMGPGGRLRSAQIPLHLSYPTHHEVHEMMDYYKKGKITRSEMEKYFMGIALDRPEFALHIAKILYGGRGGSGEYSKKELDAIKEKMIQEATRIKYAYLKSNPLSPHLITNKDLSSLKINLGSSRFDNDQFSDMHQDESVDRKRKMIKRKRIIKRKPIKKVCKCRK